MRASALLALTTTVSVATWYGMATAAEIKWRKATDQISTNLQPKKLSPSVKQDATCTSGEFQNGPLLHYIRGWWVVGITIASAFPWAVVAVLDAIDSSYRRTNIIVARLMLSAACLLIAYISGLLFIVILWINIVYHCEEGRHDEVATVLVLLVFNLWHFGRNIRGWMQYWALHKLNPIFSRLQRNLAASAPPDPDPAAQNRPVCEQGIRRLRISNRLIDNDWNKETPFLSPFYNYTSRSSYSIFSCFRTNSQSLSPDKQHSFDGADKAHDKTENEEVWAVAAWRAWWTQDTVTARGTIDLTTATEDFDWCRKTNRQPLAEGLLSGKGPQILQERMRDRIVIDSDTPGRPQIKTATHWAKCLSTYGSDEGQQDTCGEPVMRVANFWNERGVAVVVHEKTRNPPNRMSALWYNTARFEQVYANKCREVQQMQDMDEILLPKWSSWLHIAQDIGAHLPSPIFLSDVHLINYAGEMASASVIITRYPHKYRQLVEQIYEDGLQARWTFGWSGLLACFSKLWTTERIHIAMLNGLSLLTLDRFGEVKNIDENVRSMLYGYAAYAVSDRAVGKKIAQERKAELLKRYREDRGKTCRGSGVCATRIACQQLDLPAEASHMDGLPAFSTGWASEYMERKPGNQKAEHGTTHDEVEKRHGSSNTWRYPSSHL